MSKRAALAQSGAAVGVVTALLFFPLFAAAQGGASGGQGAWERCRVAGEVLGEVARQRDGGLPREAAILAVEYVWGETSDGAVTWKRLAEVIYSERSARSSPMGTSTAFFTMCVQQAAAAQASPFSPVDPAVRQRQVSMVEVMRAATPPATVPFDDVESQRRLEQRLAAAIPGRDGETGENRQRRIVALAEVSLAPLRARATEQARLQADRQAQQERRAVEARQRAEAAALASAEADRQAIAWLREVWGEETPLPEDPIQLATAKECVADVALLPPSMEGHVSRLRRDPGERALVRRHCQRAARWQIVDVRQGTCEPLDEFQPMAQTPADLLTALRLRMSQEVRLDWGGDPNPDQAWFADVLAPGYAPLGLARTLALCLNSMRLNYRIRGRITPDPLFQQRAGVR